MSYFVKHRPFSEHVFVTKSDYEVDQFPALPQNIGENGFPLTDLALLRKAQTEQEFALIAQRMVDMKADETNVGKTDEEILSMIKPRNAQSNYEVQEYIDRVNALMPVDVPLADKSADEKPAVEKPVESAPVSVESNAS